MTTEGGEVSILLFQNERSKKDCLLGGGGQKWQIFSGVICERSLI